MKLYGTLGPACGDEEILLAMLRAGMTGIRLNISHAPFAVFGNWLSALERAEKRAGVRVKYL